MIKFTQSVTKDTPLKLRVRHFPQHWFPYHTWQNSDKVNRLLKIIFIVLLLDSKNQFKRYMDMYVDMIDEVREIERKTGAYVRMTSDKMMSMYLTHCVPLSQKDDAKSILKSINVFTELVLNTNPRVTLFWPMFLMKHPKRDITNRFAALTPRYTMYKHFVKRLLRGVRFDVNADNANYYDGFVDAFVKGITEVRKQAKK